MATSNNLGNTQPTEQDFQCLEELINFREMGHNLPLIPPLATTSHSRDSPISSLSATRSEGSQEDVAKNNVEGEGLINRNSQPKASPNDEITREMSRVDSELTAITASNCERLKQILCKAKEDMAKEELNKKMEVVDHEICEVYEKFVAAKLSKRELSMLEKEQAKDLTKKKVCLLYGPEIEARDVENSQSTHVRPETEKSPSNTIPMQEEPLDLSCTQRK